MKEILLTIALAIAIAMDIVRIYQYIQTTKRNKNKIIKNVANKVTRLYGAWIADSSNSDLFDDYAIKHWEDID